MRRDGFTLVEVLVALVLTAVVGAAVTSVFVTQNAFYDTQEKVTSARAVSRAATNMMLTELRAVETTSGIVAAGPDSLRVRVPFALGVSCGQDLLGVHVSILPVDSTAWVDGLAAYGGYLWRNPATGGYAQRTGGSVDIGSTVCSSGAFPISTTFSEMNDRAHVIRLPLAAVVVPVATAVLLYQEVTYRFDDSGMVAGARGLFRQVTGGAPEELASPFDETARFRFYELDEVVAQDAPPTNIDDLRGVELVLTGVSERPDADGSERITPLTTAIFFRNRID